jgi:hypothetical protein
MVLPVLLQMQDGVLYINVKMGQPETILAQISPEHTILKICIIGQKEKNSTEKPGRYFK